jgi:hypothetical protein
MDRCQLGLAMPHLTWLNFLRRILCLSFPLPNLDYADHITIVVGEGLTDCSIGEVVLSMELHHE